jgi:hypothetical protein
VEDPPHSATRDLFETYGRRVMADDSFATYDDGTAGMGGFW